MSSSPSHHLWNEDPLAQDALHGLPGVMAWIRTLPEQRQRQLCAAILEGDEDLPKVVERLAGVLENPETLPTQRAAILSSLEKCLFPDRSVAPRQVGNSQQDDFIRRLRQWMARRGLTQQELAEKLQITQPAISQLLNRKRRPQKQTILALAQALRIDPAELWPELEVAEMLDAVAEFQEDGELSEAEAAALRDPGRKTRPRGDDGPLPMTRR